MSDQANIVVDPAELPTPRSFGKRLRHYRRDWSWRLRLRRLPRDPVPEGRADPQCPDFAVGAIAISRKYCDWCLSMIDTLRRAGEYSGPVYVVTNRPEMFAEADNVFPITVPYSRVRLISKSCKPMLFEWLPHRYVAYIDADVIVTAPIAAWYRRARERLARVAAPLLTYRAGNPLPDSFHGGLLFAEREAALPFLRRWLGMLRSGRYLSDQVALKRIATADAPAYYDDEGFIYLYKLVEGSPEGARTEPPTFVHVTDRMIQDHPPEELKAYLSDRLGVARLPEHFGPYQQGS